MWSLVYSSWWVYPVCITSSVAQKGAFWSLRKWPKISNQVYPDSGWETRYLNKTLCYELQLLILKHGSNYQAGMVKQKTLSSCIMGNIKSTVFEAWTILGSKSQIILVYGALISEKFFWQIMRQLASRYRHIKVPPFLLSTRARHLHHLYFASL